MSILAFMGGVKQADAHGTRRRRLPGTATRLKNVVSPWISVLTEMTEKKEAAALTKVMRVSFTSLRFVGPS